MRELPWIRTRDRARGEPRGDASVHLHGEWDVCSGETQMLEVHEARDWVKQHRVKDSASAQGSSRGHPEVIQTFHCSTWSEKDKLH